MLKLSEFMDRILIYLTNFVSLENTLASLFFTFAQRKSLKFVPPMVREHANCTEVALGRTSKCYVGASEGEGLLGLFRSVRLRIPTSHPSYPKKRCVFFRISSHSPNRAQFASPLPLIRSRQLSGAQRPLGSAV